MYVMVESVNAEQAVECRVPLEFSTSQITKVTNKQKEHRLCHSPT